jgi:MFS family permease
MTDTPAARIGRFSSLKNYNVRLYVFGQGLSMVGTFVQMIAQAWLVLGITKSATAFTSTIILQYLPLLVFGSWGGLVADRIDNRKLLLTTSSLAGAFALVLGVLTQTHRVTLAIVQVLAFTLGTVSAFERPAAQAYLNELAGPIDTPNAVAVNAMIFPFARLVGPAIAGLLLTNFGSGPCFLVNAVSYLFVIGALLKVRLELVHDRTRTPRAKGQLADGVRYAWHNPAVRTPLITIFVVGTLAFNFTTVMPLMAKYTFHKGAAWLTAAQSVSAVGSLLGGWLMATLRTHTNKILGLTSVMFGMGLFLLAAAPNIWWWIGIGFPVGVAATWFSTSCTTLLQMNTDPAMLGRVMALYSIGFLGTTPLGAAVVGVLTNSLSARAPFLIGGPITALVGVALMVAAHRTNARSPARSLVCE